EQLPSIFRRERTELSPCFSRRERKLMWLRQVRAQLRIIWQHRRPKNFRIVLVILAILNAHSAPVLDRDLLCGRADCVFQSLWDEILADCVHCDNHYVDGGGCRSICLNPGGQIRSYTSSTEDHVVNIDVVTGHLATFIDTEAALLRQLLAKNRQHFLLAVAE